MEFRICGFLPKAASELGLDAVDLLLLETFLEEKRSEYIIEDSKVYYFLNVEKIKDDLPILDMDKASFYNKFKKMIELHVLEKCSEEQDYYTVGPNYYFLLDPDKYPKYNA